MIKKKEGRVYMTKLDEIKAEIKQLEKELEGTKDYNEQWRLGHKLMDLKSDVQMQLGKLFLCLQIQLWLDCCSQRTH